MKSWASPRLNRRQRRRERQQDEQQPLRGLGSEQGLAFHRHGRHREGRTADQRAHDVGVGKSILAIVVEGHLIACDRRRQSAGNRQIAREVTAATDRHTVAIHQSDNRSTLRPQR